MSYPSQEPPVGVPVTEIRDADVGGITTPLSVRLAGTFPVEVTVLGSISADIGRVKLEDELSRTAVLPPASDAKTGATEALVVQHVDAYGQPLSQTTQATMLNNQGTLATQSALETANTLLQNLIVTTGTVNGTLMTATLFDAQVGAGTSASIDVSGRTHHTVQHVVNGAGTVTIETSLNGANCASARHRVSTAGGVN